MNKYFRQRKVRKVRKRKEGTKGEKTNRTRKDEWTVTMPRRFMWGAGDSLVGRIRTTHPTPARCPHPIPVTCAYITLQGKRDSAGVTKLRILT